MNNYVELLSDDKTIVLKDITIENQELYSALKEMDAEKRLDLVIRTLDIGIIGLKGMKVGKEVHYVEKEFEKMSRDIDKMFDPERKDSHLGQFAH